MWPEQGSNPQTSACYAAAEVGSMLRAPTDLHGNKVPFFLMNLGLGKQDMKY